MTFVLLSYKLDTPRITESWTKSTPLKYYPKFHALNYFRDRSDAKKWLIIILEKSTAIESMAAMVYWQWWPYDQLWQDFQVSQSNFRKLRCSLQKNVKIQINIMTSVVTEIHRKLLAIKVGLTIIAILIGNYICHMFLRPSVISREK